MNREELFGAITNISDSFIEEADPDAGSGFLPKIRRLRPAFSVAAVFVLVLGIAAAAVQSGLLNGVGRDDASAEDAAVAEFSLKMTEMDAENSGDTTYAIEQRIEEITEEAADMNEKEDAPETHEMLEGETAASMPEEMPGENDVHLEHDDFSADHAETPETGNEDVDGVDSEFQGIQDEELIPKEQEIDLSTLPVGYPNCIVWNNTQYTLIHTMYLEISAQFTCAGHLSNETGSEFYADSSVFLGAAIYASTSDTSCIFIPYGDGYLCYVR